jgi:hypothetical protein
MDKLEQYIEQVCKSIGGPFDLRQHVRQELREHLLDAVAQHKAAGLAEADAVAKALDEFGKPEEVRSELESAYGQRTMWIIDKALQWKEMTMRAKWLWTTWAYLALVAVIALEVTFLWFMGVFIVPRFNSLLRLGMIDAEMLQEQAASAWMPGFLNDLNAVGGGYALWWILLAIVLIGLFEWRVKSENKTFMRLSGLGTIAVGLMIAVTLTGVALIIPPCLAMPAIGIMTRPWAVEQVAVVDKSLNALDEAHAKKNFAEMRKPMKDASDALSRLSSGPAVFSLTNWNVPPTFDQLRENLTAAQSDFRAVELAFREENPDKLKPAFEKFRRSFEPVSEVAKRPAR